VVVVGWVWNNLQHVYVRLKVLSPSCCQTEGWQLYVG